MSTIDSSFLWNLLIFHRLCHLATRARLLQHQLCCCTAAYDPCKFINRLSFILLQLTIGYLAWKSTFQLQCDKRRFPHETWIIGLTNISWKGSRKTKVWRLEDWWNEIDITVDDIWKKKKHMCRMRLGGGGGWRHDNCLFKILVLGLSWDILLPRWQSTVRDSRWDLEFPKNVKHHICANTTFITRINVKMKKSLLVLVRKWIFFLLLKA